MADPDLDYKMSDLRKELDSTTQNGLHELVELWRQIGIENCTDRVQTVAQLIKARFDDMIAEEKANLNAILDSIEKKTRERMKILKELNLNEDSEFVTSMEESTLIQVEYKIKTEVIRLRGLRDERMQKLEDLKKKDVQLSTSLGISLSWRQNDCVPSEDQLADLEARLADAESLKEQRMKVFTELKDELMLLYTKLDIEPRSTLERNVLCDDEYIALRLQDQNQMESAITKLKAEDEANTAECKKILTKIEFITRQLGTVAPFTMDDETSSAKVIEKMRAALSELEKERKKHMAEFIDKSKKEVESLWDACFVGGEHRNEFLGRAEMINDQEKLLTSYEDEINTWKTYSDTNKNLLKKITSWDELWSERIALEAAYKDPGRLFGPPLALLEEDKRRKYVINRLPKIEKEIAKLCREYESANGRAFLINGVTFEQFCFDRENQHEAEVQKEREMKKMKSKQQTMMEATYGSTRQKTPARKDMTMRNRTAVKRLQDSRVAPKPSAGRTFSATPGRKALRDKNDTFIAGSHNQAGSTIASIDDNLFKGKNYDIASSTLLRGTKKTPIARSSPRLPMSSSNKGGSTIANRTRTMRLRNLKKTPFLL